MPNLSVTVSNKSFVKILDYMEDKDIRTLSKTVDVIIEEFFKERKKSKKV